MNERIKPFEEKMGKSLDALKEDYSTIRAGRANPHLLDKLRVDYYGTPSPLQSVANISVPEARVIQIQPWESKMIKEIEKAILASDLGLNPSNDGKAIRLVFPELTEDRRKELVKDVKKKAEQACADIGMSLSTAINIYLKKLGRERRIPFEVAVDPFYSEENMSRLRKSVAQMEATGGTIHEVELDD